MPPIESTITEVTVFYNNGARVTRRGSLELAAGTHTVTFSLLPQSVYHMREAIRVSGRGSGVTILDVRAREVQSTARTEARLSEIDTRKRALEAQLRALEAELDRLASQERLLFAVRDSGSQSLARMLAYKRATLDDIDALAQYLQVQLGQIAQRQAEIERERLDIQNELTILAAEARPDVESHGEVEVSVEAAEPTLLVLDLIYMVGGRWWPVYDLRLYGTEITMTYMAYVTQSSGEDWHNVSLTLSTAEPLTSTTLPKLAPQYLNRPMPRYFPAPASARGGVLTGSALGAPMPARLSKPRAAADSEMDAPAPAEAAETEAPQRAGAALSYPVSYPVTVISAGSQHGSAEKVTVTTQRLTAELDYYSVPKLAEEAYLRAKITNSSAYTLVPGEASIFHEEMFVGKTQLERITPGEEFDALLGVDDRIKVKRELLLRDVAKRFIGSNRQTQIAYKISVSNLTDTQARVTLMDQIPLARTEQISVKLLNASPGISEQDKLNILTWVLALKPGEKQNVSFTFQVEHPRDMEITGLD